MKKLVKNLVMVAIMFAMTSISAFAQSTVKHTVDRGETLATIAKRYGTTEARIIELNPDAAQFIYVGMELTVEVTAASDGKQDAAAPQSNPSGNAIFSSQNVSQNVESSSSYEEPKERKGTFAGGFEFTAGFISKSESAKVEGTRAYSAPKYSYRVVGGASYNITNELFAGAKIGWETVHSSGTVNNNVTGLIKSEDNFHFITIPLEVGYVLGNPEKFSLVPFAGADLNFCLSAKRKTEQSGNKESNKIKCDDFGANFRLGIKVGLWGINIIGSYMIPTYKDVYGDKNYFSVGLGFGI